MAERDNAQPQMSSGQGKALHSLARIAAAHWGIVYVKEGRGQGVLFLIPYSERPDKMRLLFTLGRNLLTPVEAVEGILTWSLEKSENLLVPEYNAP
jgi:hypothetical protein